MNGRSMSTNDQLGSCRCDGLDLDIRDYPVTNKVREISSRISTHRQAPSSKYRSSFGGCPESRSNAWRRSRKNERPTAESSGHARRVLVRQIRGDGWHDLYHRKAGTCAGSALQRELDRRRGLRTAGYISGYRGSPLGTLDNELLKKAAPRQTSCCCRSPCLTTTAFSREVGLA